MQNHLTILLLLVLYSIMLLMFVWLRKMKSETVHSEKVQQGNWNLIHSMHAAGIMIMMLPLFFVKNLPVFLLPFPDKISVDKAYAFLIFFGIIGFFPWKKVNVRSGDPANISTASVHQVSLYVMLRVAFLISYEWFFRGLLLISFSVWLGISWSIVINIVLYVLLHIHKNKKEMIGCIPFGLLLCVFTIWWQSLWPAIIFHLQLAIMNEWPLVQQFIPPTKRTAV